MRIDELEWDDWNEEHIAKHGVDPSEIEEVVFDRASTFMRGGLRNSVATSFWGLTDAGRYLFVILELVGTSRGYAVTARDMTDDEKHRFKARR